MNLVRAILIRPDMDVDRADDEGMTALHRAAIKNNLECLRLLLEAGADSTAADKKERTPLHAAS